MPCEGAKGKEKPPAVVADAWTEAEELEVLETEAVDMLGRHGRRAACAAADRGPSGEARDDADEVLYEIELRVAPAWRGRALE